MMTRKDYVATAKIIRNFFDACIDEEAFDDSPINAMIHDHLIDEFIKMFSADNPNFDADKFWEACTE